MAAKQITAAQDIFFQTIPKKWADETGGGLCHLLDLPLSSGTSLEDNKTEHHKSQKSAWHCLT